MNTNHDHDVADDDAPIVDFGRRNPLEIGVSLRNLANRGDFPHGSIRRCADRHAHPRCRYDGEHLHVRLGRRTRAQQVRAGGAEAVLQRDAGRRARGIHDRHAAQDQLDGHPAFVVEFPPVLYYMQRREYFRVEAPVLDPYICSGSLPDGERFRFEVHDLSLGGVALRTTDERVADLETGITIEDAELHFTTTGKVTLDLKLVSHRESTTTKGDHRFTLGFKFLSMPGSAENTLQRLITQLEMKRRALSK